MPRLPAGSKIIVMRHLTRIRIAALSAAFFLGGVTAAGFGIRAARDTGSTPVSTVRPRTQVLHQTRIRTAHVRAKRAHSSSSPPGTETGPVSAPRQVVGVPPSQTRTVVAQAPAKVQSRVSPAGGKGEDDGGEHEGRDD